LPAADRAWAWIFGARRLGMDIRRPDRDPAGIHADVAAICSYAQTTPIAIREYVLRRSSEHDYPAAAPGPR
jgi:hypothetical protein